MTNQIAFLNAVAANGGVVTDEIRKRFGVTKPKPAKKPQKPKPAKTEPKGAELTREGIAEMDDDSIKEALKSHGVEDVPEDASIEDLRQALINIVFVGA